MTLADGTPGSGAFVNAAMLHDPAMGRFWTLREGKPMPRPAAGSFCPVSDSVQLAWIAEDALLGVGGAGPHLTCHS